MDEACVATFRPTPGFKGRTFVYHCRELPQVPRYLMATNICRDKYNFVATKALSRQAYFFRDKRRVLSWLKRVCRDKNDTCGSRQWRMKERDWRMKECDWRMKECDWRMKECDWRMKECDWRMKECDWRMKERDWRMKERDWRMTCWLTCGHHLMNSPRACLFSAGRNTLVFFTELKDTDIAHNTALHVQNSCCP